MINLQTPSLILTGCSKTQFIDCQLWYKEVPAKSEADKPFDFESKGKTTFYPLRALEKSARLFQQAARADLSLSKLEELETITTIQFNQ